MIVFRWIVGVLAAFFAVAALLGFAFHVAFDSSVWLGRARRMGRGLWLIMLLWFNVEVWGRVAYTLIHWRH
ncbi:MAG TPA: hypothetical protein VFF72_03565 [Caldimonas sp.]|nr:hypothetical protein [Caldimonas sp.]